MLLHPHPLPPLKYSLPLPLNFGGNGAPRSRLTLTMGRGIPVPPRTERAVQENISTDSVNAFSFGITPCAQEHGF